MAAKIENYKLDPGIKQVLMARKGATIKAGQMLNELKQLREMIGMTDKFLHQAATGMPNDIAQQEEG